LVDTKVLVLSTDGRH